MAPATPEGPVADTCEHHYATLQRRLRLAHQARHEKIRQLDDIRHALIETGLIKDDDHYGHADLADLIRQNWDGGKELDDKARARLDRIRAIANKVGGRAAELLYAALDAPDSAYEPDPSEQHAGHGSPCETRPDGTCAFPYATGDTVTASATTAIGEGPDCGPTPPRDDTNVGYIVLGTNPFGQPTEKTDDGVVWDERRQRYTEAWRHSVTDVMRLADEEQQALRAELEAAQMEASRSNAEGWERQYDRLLERYTQLAQRALNAEEERNRLRHALGTEEA